MFTHEFGSIEFTSVSQIFFQSRDDATQTFVDGIVVDKLLSRPDNHISDGQRDRAHLFAAATQSAGVGEMFVCVDCFQIGERNMSDGTCKNVVVRLIANSLINGANVVAAATTEAGESWAQFLVLQQTSALIVDNKQVVVAI